MSQPLPTAILGRTGLRVTRLGYGAGHRKPMDGRQSNVILNAVLDSGINLLDTADDYGNSEELIGRYLSHRRSEFYLATKCGVSPSMVPLKYIPRNLRASTRRTVGRDPRRRSPDQSCEWPAPGPEAGTPGW